MNPDLMRSTYGKLMYLLQDAGKPDISRQLGMVLRKPIVTVKAFAEDKGMAAILEDPKLNLATQDVRAGKPTDGSTIQQAVLANSEVTCLVVGVTYAVLGVTGCCT